MNTRPASRSVYRWVGVGVPVTVAVIAGAWASGIRSPIHQTTLEAHVVASPSAVAATRAPEPTPSLDAPADGGTPQPAMDPTGQCALTQRLTPVLGQDRPGENFVWSPHSLAVGLSVVAIGARGRTLQQILDLMNFRGSARELARAQVDSEASHVAARSPANGFAFERAVAIWSEGLLPAFRRDVRAAFPDVALYEAEFRSESGRARAVTQINAWASQKTQGQLRELLPPNWVPPPGPPVGGWTGSILVNTLLVRALWHDLTELRSGAFRTASGKNVRADFVVFSANFPYLLGEHVVGVSLPLSGTLVRAVFLLPRNASLPLERVPLDGLCALRSTHPEHVHVEVPRFHVSFAADLKEPLRRLGLEDLFEPGVAELLIASPQSWIHEVRQRSDIRLDERGIAAASGTAVQERLESAPRERLVFDRPFWFSLVGPAGRVLFAGRVTDPSTKQASPSTQTPR